MPSVFESVKDIPELIVIKPKLFTDERGYFMEIYRSSELRAQNIGPFVQENESESSRGSLRGLHFQKPPSAQGKLVRATRGKIFDVAVDIRKKSSTYGKWFGIELSEENKTLLWVPAGFAHGFLALTDGTRVNYRVSGAEYHQPSETGIAWDDPTINIDWPAEITHPLLSKKDRTWLALSQTETGFINEI